MHVNAELIIYGGTEPNAKVRIDGHDISLSPDGTFSYHFVFPDGQFHIPIEATSADGVEKRSALLSFLRLTDLEGDVRKTGQPGWTSRSAAFPERQIVAAVYDRRTSCLSSVILSLSKDQFCPF